MKDFNINDWLPEEQVTGASGGATSTPATHDLVVLEKAVTALEISGKDITATYAQWRDIGFALAELGEAGRDFFHRVSRMHPSYEASECDRQFQRCLNSKGSGISLGTFYHHLKSAGIPIPRLAEERAANASAAAGGRGSNSGGRGNRPPDQDPGFQEPQDGDEEVSAQEKMPVFPEGLYDKLPDFLKQVVAPCDGPEEKDIMLLGTLTVLSSCLTNFFGLYDGKVVRPNLYLFITAIASAGKGRLSLCRKLVLPIHRAKREEAKNMKQQYETDLAEFNAAKEKNSEKPVRPPEKMLFIPANSSSTGMFQLLSDNEGKGLIFETEGDTLSQVFKNEYSNYSDGYRKAWHHETISYYRRTEREYVDIEAPCLSTLLTGTPKQVFSLIPSAENGLFSRFLFYYMNFEPVWKKVFERKRSLGITEHYDSLGQDFYLFHDKLLKAGEVEVELSDAQIEQFYEYFSRTQLKYFSLFDEHYVASVRRLGLIFFRLAILLSATRFIHAAELPKKIQCSDEDFGLVLEMIPVLLKHSTRVYNSLPMETKPPVRKNIKEKFLDALPKLFNRQHYLEIAYILRIPPKTAEKYVGIFVKTGVIEKTRYNEYSFPEGLIG